MQEFRKDLYFVEWNIHCLYFECYQIIFFDYGCSIW